MLDAVLREGFRLAHGRLRFVFLDLLWKAIWCLITAVALAAIAMWFGSRLQSIEWIDTENRTINSPLAYALLRRFWAAYSGEMFAAIAIALVLSVALWFVLEATFRARIIQGRFEAFLLARASKCLFMGAATFAFGAILFGAWREFWPDTRPAAVVALISLAALSFLLTVIETLIRANAVDLLGTDLFRVIGLIGILVLLEMMISGSAAILVAAGFLNTASLASALVMTGTAVVAIIFMTVLHSYLLLVRFSAIGIMRENVIEI